MISEISLKISEIVRMSKGAVSVYCRRHGLPTVSVNVGTVISNSFAEYDIGTNCIFISCDAGECLRKYRPDERVWWLNNYIYHELTHYRQRFTLIKMKKPFVRKNFDENEARREAEHYADSILSTYSKEDINPIRSKKMGSDLYESFHGVSPVRKTKVYFEPPTGELISIGELSQVNYRPVRGKYRNTEFYHKSGDLGERMLKTNLILATDKAGKNLYLVRKNKNSKYPVFSSRGILG